MLLRVELQVSYLDGLKIKDRGFRKQITSIELSILHSYNICIAKNCLIR